MVCLKGQTILFEKIILGTLTIKESCVIIKVPKEIINERN